VKDNTKINFGKLMYECIHDSRGLESGTVVAFVEEGDERFRFHKRRKSFDYIKSRRFYV
jgi:hypothetical protein